jgi:hypothetical protein
MANKLSVLIELNVVLDVLQKREPFYDSSATLLAAAETGKIQGYISAHSVTTLFYLLQKGISSSEARAVLTNLLQFMKIAGIDQSTIEQALNLDFEDFEDAVQMMAAVQCRADYLVTRNVKDYTSPLLPVVQPIDFVTSALG